MPRSRSRSVVLAALVALVVAGCGAAPAGPPDPFPPRPADIDIERLDPCTLLSAEKRAELQVGAGQAGTAPVSGATTRACGWGSLDTPFDYSVQLIPQDAAAAVGASGAVVGTAEGYGTVQITDRRESYPLCEVLVDVNDGQLMRIQVRTVERERVTGEPYRIEETCSHARLAVGEVVRNAREQAP